MLRCEHEKIIVEENMFRLDEANRLRLEEENMLQLEEQKKNKRKEFMNSSHGKSILAKLAPTKRNQLDSSSEKINSKVSWVKIKKYCQNVNDPCTAKLLKNVKPWVEDISRVLHCMDTIWLSDDIERFLGQPGQVKCKFPWNDDYTVDRNFWLKLLFLDLARKGWLTEDVFIPINETGEHWCLAQFHILSGEVTFYDTGYTYDYDYRDCDSVMFYVVLPLIYGNNCHLPFEIEHRAYWALKNYNPDLIAAGEKRMFQLHELDELRYQAYENSRLYKERTKVWHDRKLRMRKEFKQGNKVLLFHSKYKFKQPKLRSRWLGTYVVKHQYPSGYVELYGKDGKTFIVNGHRLKLYHEEDNDPREAVTPFFPNK
ncbi:reverse transcriptase domain-containing protein [Tanacetum coccineum]